MCPIRGLTDRGLAFPEIGQIRKGAKKDPNVNKPGPDLSFFRVEFDEKEVEAKQTFYKYYGAQPDEIHIVLPFNDIERMWDAWLEAYAAGRMVARSDGERFIYLVDTQTGEMVIKNGMDKEGKPRPYLEGQVVGYDYQNKPIKCKVVGRLKVIIPELQRAAYMLVMTTSVHDIANISAQLEALKQLNGGQIAGIPLILRRRPKKISRPDKDGKRVRVEKYLISIEADPEWVRAKLNQVKYLALPGNGLDKGEPPIESEIIEMPGFPIEDDEDADIPENAPAPDFGVEADHIEESPEERPHTMTLEEAKLVTNSQGTPYGALSRDKLSYMSGQLILSLELEKDPKKRTVLERKLEAIKKILSQPEN
jgi:hypothetical protein